MKSVRGDSDVNFIRGVSDVNSSFHPTIVSLSELLKMNVFTDESYTIFTSAYHWSV